MRNFIALMAMVLAGGALIGAQAQGVPALDSIKSQDELTKAVTELDKELFDAYNTCNIDKLGTLVTDGLELSSRFWIPLKRTSVER